jgi:chemotaxis signal transduction protein
MNSNPVNSGTVNGETVFLVRIAGASLAIPVSRITAVTRIPAIDPIDTGCGQLLGRFLYRGTPVLCADLAPEFTGGPHVYGAGARLLLLDGDAVPLAVPVDSVGSLHILADESRQQSVARSSGRFHCVDDLFTLDGEVVFCLDVRKLRQAVEQCVPAERCPAVRREGAAA